MDADDIRPILFDFAPEFETEVEADVARVDRFIGYATNQMVEATYTASEETDEVDAGTYFNQAAALLTAHLLKLRAMGGAAGAIVSEKVGDLAVSYAAPQSDSALMRTSYGAQYLECRKTAFPGAWAV